MLKKFRELQTVLTLIRLQSDLGLHCLFKLLCCSLNPLYAGGLFYCYMLDEAICHFRDIGSVLLFYSIFDERSC